MGGKQEGQNSKGRETGGAGCFVIEYMCEIIEVTKDAKFNESTRFMIQGEREMKELFVGTIYMPPESKSTQKGDGNRYAGV